MQAFSLVLVLAMGLAEEPVLTRESYIDLIARYRRGELDLGAERQAFSSKHDLERIVDGLTRHPVERMDGKAAVLLHTEAAFLNRDPGDESARDLHMDLAEKILLELVDDLDFERRWRLAAGFFYQSSLSPGRALHHLEAARILAPSAAETYMAIAMVHEAMGALALSTLPRWDVSVFDQSRRDRERIQLASRDGRQQLWQAIEQYSKVLQSNPQSAAAHLRRGRCFQLLSLRDEAAEELERALELEPSEYERALARLFLGQLRAESGDYEAAAGHYRESLRGLPAWQAVYFGLSHALQEVGEREESRLVLERALQIEVAPGDPRGGIWQYHLRVDAYLDGLDQLRREALR